MEDEEPQDITCAGGIRLQLGAGVPEVTQEEDSDD
jgi:hypothetical protein